MTNKRLKLKSNLKYVQIKLIQYLFKCRGDTIGCLELV